MFKEEVKDNKVNKVEHINKLMSRYADNKLIDKEIHSNKNVAIDKTNYNRGKNNSQRGEIWYVNFGCKKGSVQSGIRPCIIGSNPINNQYSTIRNVYPVSSKINKSKKVLVHVEIEG
jgi:hypothetical protein